MQWKVDRAFRTRVLEQAYATGSRVTFAKDIYTTMHVHGLPDTHLHNVPNGYNIETGAYRRQGAPVFSFHRLGMLICSHASIGVGRPLPCHALKSCAIGRTSS